MCEVSASRHDTQSTALAHMTSRHYDHAPIVEAVLDFKVVFEDEFSIARVEVAAARVSSRFPTKLPIHLGQISLEFKAGAGQVPRPSVSSNVQVGLRLSTEKNDRVLQMQRAGFTFSHLAPYTEWGNLRDEAKDAWKVFCEECHPKFVTRVATRAINRIEIPSGKIEPEDYFHLCAKIPKGIPQDVTGMFLQLQMPQSDIGAVALVNHALVDNPAPNQISFLLDLDLFRQQTQIEPGADELWELVEQLHERRNDLFEACITDRTRELIK